MKYLIDSDWLIDALGDRSGPVQALARFSAEGVAISVIAVAEVYEGAFGAPDPARTLADFRAFLGDYPVLPLTDSIAERFARLRFALRREGRLIPDMDLLISATALEENLTLVTRNVRHFERIPELRLYQPI